jgi:Autophagy-related protein 101
VWTVRLELLKLYCEDEKQLCREKISDMITDKIFYITEVINRHDYIPKMPNQSELDLIFDTSYPDVQPYNFTVKFSTSEPSGSNTVGNTMKKIFKETLSLWRDAAGRQKFDNNSMIFMCLVCVHVSNAFLHKWFLKIISFTFFFLSLLSVNCKIR